MVWRENFRRLLDAAQKREKQEWANEKPELDNARRMRGTYFIDPRQGLARRMAQSPAMLFMQTCHPHFSSFPRLRAICRVPGPLAPPVSPAYFVDRPVQSAPDRRVADLVVEPRSRTWSWSQLAGLAPQRPLACDLRARGFCFVTESSLAENFYVITQHHCAVLLNKGTFTRDFPCMPRYVSCSPRYSSFVDCRGHGCYWQVLEGV